MTLWLLVTGCGREPEPRPPPPEDPGRHTGVDEEPHTGSTPEPHTGALHTASVPRLHSAGEIDSGFVPLRSDSGGPACVPTLARNRSILTGWVDPALTYDCPISEVPAVTPGPRVRAEDLARARIDPTSRRYGHCGEGVMMVGDTDGDGVGEYVVMCTKDGLLLAYEGMPEGTLGTRDADTVVDLHGDHAWVEQGALLGPGTHALVVGPYQGGDAWVLPLPLPLGEWNVEDVGVGRVLGQPFAAAGGVVSVGDWNVDGTDDLTVAGLNDVGLAHGGVSLFLGPIDSDRNPVAPDLHMRVDDADQQWGENEFSGVWSRALLPDLDGDGYPELLVGGERSQNLVYPLYDVLYPHGSLWLYEGGVGLLGEWSSAEASARLYGSCDAYLAAFMSRSVGDVTGDCLPDIATGGARFNLGDGYHRGAVFVLSELRRVQGTLPIEKAATAIILGEEVGDELSSVGFVGDWNLDGYDELVVGARDPWEEGAVYIFLGPVSGTMSAADADLVLTGGGEGSYFGTELRGGRDLDGDGIPDLLVGAYGATVNGVEQGGSVFVFSGADLLNAM